MVSIIVKRDQLDLTDVLFVPVILLKLFQWTIMKDMLLCWREQRFWN